MAFATPSESCTPGHLLPMYPMTVADVLDGAFRTWRGVIVVVTLAIVLITGPIEVLGALLLYRTAPQLLLQGMPADPATSFGALGAVLLISMVSAIVRVYAASVILVAIQRADRGRRPALGPSVAAGVRPAAVSLVALLLVGIAAFALMFVAVFMVAITLGFGAIIVVPAGLVAGAVLAAVGALTIPIAVVEGGGPIATLGRAVWVLRARFWRTVGITLLVMVVLLGMTAGASFLLELVALAAGSWAWVVLSVGQLVLSLVNLPIASIAALLVFNDARMANEGYDLEVRIDRLAVA